MRFFRLLFTLILSIFIVYAPTVTDILYLRVVESDFSKRGSLTSFQVECDHLNESVREGCSILYKIPVSEFSSFHHSDLIEIGVGVLVGGAEWYCIDENQIIKIFENGKMSFNTTSREGLMLYSTATIPASICKKDLFIKMTSDPRHPVTKLGWKSGSLVTGSPAVVRSYKNVIDFFSSYLRILLSLICFLFLMVLRHPGVRVVQGYAVYRRAISLFSLHFLASSSIFDVLIPNSIGFGFVILMAAGSAGGALLIVSTMQSISSSFGGPLLRPSGTADSRSTFSALLFLFLFFYYAVDTGRNYHHIQAGLSVLLLIVSAMARAPSTALFSILFLGNVLAGYGVFPGQPTNTATHFVLILFIVDSFEQIHVANWIDRRVSGQPSTETVTGLLSLLAHRFGIRRLSTSMFTKDFEFVTKQISNGSESILDVSSGVSSLSAHVMTARQPLLRIRVGSQESRILKGPGAPEDKKKGLEFCIFPLIYSEKALGTLNISGYSITALSDPSQMLLFYSMLERIVPLVAQVRYREDLSPNIEDQHSIQEIESAFLGLKEKSKISLIEGLNAIARRIDARIIVSKALPRMDRFETFSSHQYGREEAAFLENHAPRLSNALVVSPANIAFHQEMTVYISHVEGMFSIYAEFLVKLLKKNGTKTLLVEPLYVGQTGSTSSPWGVLWIEFTNRLQRPDVDLRDIGNFASGAVERMLSAYLEYCSQAAFEHEFSATVPKHVLEKIRNNVDPTEREIGYFLNIDLAGSTNLSKVIGPDQFNEIIKKMHSLLSTSLAKFLFQPQIVVWDSFGFSRAEGVGIPFDEENARKLLKEIDSVVRQVTEGHHVGHELGFRAVLNFGDISRGWASGAIRQWTVTGSAYAESCKLESALKPKTGVLLWAGSCPENRGKTVYLQLNENRLIA